MVEKKIFKTLMSSEDALIKLDKYCIIEPIGIEKKPLLDTSGMIIGEDIVSSLDVPNFDKASMDGYAIVALDTFGAKEDQPIKLEIIGVSQPGSSPSGIIKQGQAIEVGTGAPIPGGANSVVMVEYTQTINKELRVYRAVSPGENITPAGSDKRTGEIVLRKGQRVSSREMGVLAAIGLNEVPVYRKPRVAIISIGNELVKPGNVLKYAQIFDINSNSVSAAVLENGGSPLKPVIVGDNKVIIKKTVINALHEADIVLTSGSTSAGAGDILNNVIEELGNPGIIAHGLSLKPGKPTLIAVINKKPLIGLPGYPTSALMIFKLVVASLIRRMGGTSEETREPIIFANVARKVFSIKGKRELMPVHLISSLNGFSVYPVAYGSGAISTMALADGYLDIPKNQEFLEEGEKVKVMLFSPEVQPADLLIIGSHCTGIDLILQHMRTSMPSLVFKVVNIGSLGGFNAVVREEADISGVHILDEHTGKYNIGHLKRQKLFDQVSLVRGYSREQGLIITKGNSKNITSLKDIFQENIIFLNRNPGSGTRMLIDLKLKALAKSMNLSFNDLKKKISGYDIEAKSHQAVAASIAQGKADVGIGIRTVAHFYNLDFIHLDDEMYDFLIPSNRMEKKAVKLFLSTLRSKEFKNDLLRKMPGLKPNSLTGNIIDKKTHQNVNFF